MADLFQPGPTVAEDLAALAAWAETLPATIQRGALLRLLVEYAGVVEVLELVRRMRQAQRAYFRSKADLPGCKALESKVDGILKSWEG